MTIDYVQKVTEGVMCPTQWGSKIAGLKELKRMDRHSQGWKFPHTFCMESSKGYWRRYVIPEIDLETGRSEYRGALPKVLASFGVTAGANAKAQPEGEGVKPKGKGREGEGGKGAGRNLTTGGTDVARLYPAGERLLKPERNLEMARAPRRGEDAFFWDCNAHGGCARGDRRVIEKHDTMSEKNLHWEIAAELIRRGGRKNRQSMIAPENADGMADQLRDSNQKAHGEQPLAATKAWWQKTAGSVNHTMVATTEAGQSDWKHTKRQLDWESVVRTDRPVKKEDIGKTGGRPMWR